MKTAINESIATDSIVSFDATCEMSDLLAEAHAMGCEDCDDDGDTIWGTFDGSEFRIRPVFASVYDEAFEAEMAETFAAINAEQDARAAEWSAGADARNAADAAAYEARCNA